jgi:hypothetical protein
MQEWLNLTTDDVWRLRKILPFVSFLVGWWLGLGFPRGAPSVGSSPKVRKLCLPPDGLHDSGRRHSHPYLQGHRSLCCTSLTSAAPGGYCNPHSVGDQTSEARDGLPLAHTILYWVGRDWVSKRRIACLNGGRSQREAHGLEFSADNS